MDKGDKLIPIKTYKKLMISKFVVFFILWLVFLSVLSLSQTDRTHDCMIKPAGQCPNGYVPLFRVDNSYNAHASPLVSDFPEYSDVLDAIEFGYVVCCPEDIRGVVLRCDGGLWVLDHYLKEDEEFTPSGGESQSGTNSLSFGCGYYDAGGNLVSCGYYDGDGNFVPCPDEFCVSDSSDKGNCDQTTDCLEASPVCRCCLRRLAFLLLAVVGIGKGNSLSQGLSRDDLPHEEGVRAEVHGFFHLYLEEAQGVI